jgi:hypothetical protein
MRDIGYQEDISKLGVEMHPKRNTQAQKVIKGQYYKYNAYF